MTNTGCLHGRAGESVEVQTPRATETAPPPSDETARLLDSTERDLVREIQRPAFGLEPQRGVRRKVLTILWDPGKDDVPPRADVDAMREVIHGTVDSVRDYFLEVSHGQFTIENAGVLGWYDSDYPPEEYWPGGGEVGRDSGAEAIRKAEADIDFSDFDEDGDGELRPHELGVLFIQPGKRLGGGLIRKVGDDYVERGEGEGVVVDGVRILDIAEVSIGSPPRPGIVAHELSHLFLALGDMYFTRFFNPMAAGPYSLMDWDGRAPHLDPVHKVKLGWLWPRVLTRPGTYELRDVANAHEATVLASPDRGADEYFIVENRRSTGTYDAAIPHRGIAVWHIIEDRETFDRFPPPHVTTDDWAREGGWSRKGIRMIRPRQEPPFDSTLPLWDGAGDGTGYDLVARLRHDEHATLRWADGSPSGFALTGIPASADTVDVDVDTGWSPGRGIEAATGRVARLRVHEHERYHHLDADVVVELDSRPDEAFGFPLRADADGPANERIFARLRDAVTSGSAIRLEFDRSGAALRRIIRVATP